MAKFFSVLMGLLVHAIRAAARGRADLVLENVALRQQVTALKQERSRPRLHDADRAFWVALRSAWPGWARRLIIVTPDSVARWQRRRFRRYWTKLSRRPRKPGRPRLAAERWVGSCRRELLDHVVVLGERHLVRLVCEYADYYHDDRCHLGLGKDTPAGRRVCHSHPHKHEPRGELTAGSSYGHEFVA